MRKSHALEPYVDILPLH